MFFDFFNYKFFFFNNFLWSKIFIESSFFFVFIWDSFLFKYFYFVFYFFFDYSFKIFDLFSVYFFYLKFHFFLHDFNNISSFNTFFFFDKFGTDRWFSNERFFNFTNKEGNPLRLRLNKITKKEDLFIFFDNYLAEKKISFSANSLANESRLLDSERFSFLMSYGFHKEVYLDFLMKRSYLLNENYFYPSHYFSFLPSYQIYPFFSYCYFYFNLPFWLNRDFFSIFFSDRYFFQVSSYFYGINCLFFLFIFFFFSFFFYKDIYFLYDCLPINPYSLRYSWNEFFYNKEKFFFSKIFFSNFDVFNFEDSDKLKLKTFNNVFNFDFSFFSQNSFYYNFREENISNNVFFSNLFFFNSLQVNSLLFCIKIILFIPY